MKTVSTFLGVAGVAAGLAVGIQAQDLRVWDQDSTSWNPDPHTADSLQARESNAAEVNVVFNSNNEMVITYQQGLTHLFGNAYNDDRNFVLRHDGGQIRVWNENTPSWDSALSNGTPIMAWGTIGSGVDAQMSRVIADSSGCVTIAGWQDVGSNYGFWLARATATDVKVWDVGTASWTTDSSLADSITRGSGYPFILTQAMAVDTNSNTYFSYYESDGSNGRIWNGGSWSTALTGGTPLDQGSGNAQAAALGNDSSGNIYMTLGYDNGTYLQRYDGTNLEVWDTDTSAWTATLSHGDSLDRGLGNAVPSVLAVDSHDDVYVLTEENRNTTSNAYYLIRYNGTDVRIWDHSATNWTATPTDGTPIIEPSLSERFYQPKMAANPQGGIYFTTHLKSESTHEVFLGRFDGTSVQLWNQDASVWTNELVGAGPLLLLESGRDDYTLSVDSEGRVYIAYRENAGEEVRFLQHNGVQARVWDAETQSWVSDFAQGDSIGGTGISVREPVSGMDQGGAVYTVVLTDYDDADRGWVAPILTRYGNFSNLPSFAEISPVEVILNTQDQAFSYYVHTPTGSSFTQVDQIAINVPTGYSAVSVSGVYSNGTSVAYTDNTFGNSISVTLDAPVPAGSAVARVDFTAKVTATPGSTEFTSMIDDTAASNPQACFPGDGDNNGTVTNNSWNVEASGLAVAQSAAGEINPVSVVMNTADQPFSYYIKPVIDPHDGGFNKIQIHVPAVYSDATLTGVFVDGTPVTHTNLTRGNTLIAQLESRVNSNGEEVRVDFTADTPSGADWGREFTFRISDHEVAGWVVCTEGDAAAGVATDVWSVEAAHVEGNFTQNSWVGGQFGPSTANIAPSGETQLGLAANEQNLELVFEFPDPEPLGRDAGTYDRIWDMEVYKNKLYMSTMREPMWTIGASIWELDATGSLSESHYTTLKAGMMYLNSIGDYLYGIGPDTSGGAKIKRFNGTVWEGIYADPSGVDEHYLDMALFRERLHVSIHTFDRFVFSFDPDEASTDQFSPTPNQIDFYDNQPDDGRDMSATIVYHDNLYIAAGGLETNGFGGEHYVRLIKWDGETPTFLHLDPVAGPPRDKQTKAIALEIFNDELYISTYDTIYRYDEVTETAEKVAEIPYAWGINALKAHNGKLYATVREDPLAGVNGHGGSGAHLFFNFGGLDAVENGQVWVSDENGGNWTALTTNLAVDVTYALESYRGRLFVGGGYENSYSDKYARLFAMPYYENGAFYSLPVDTGIDGVTYSQILFDGEIPTGTDMRFQLRTSTTEAGVQSAAFAGPDGTSGSWYTTSGEMVAAVHNDQRWFQYAAYMETTDTTNLSPMLDSISITFSDGIQVENRPVSNVMSNSATLNGEVLFVGSLSDTVYLCWGDEDGGTVSTGSWDQVIDMGTNWTPGAAFSNTVSISGGGVYYYRAYITGGGDEDWADEAEAFTYSFALPFIETFETDPDYMAGTPGSADGQHGWTADAGAVVQDGVSWEFDQAVELAGAEIHHDFEDGQTNVWTVFAIKPVAGELDVASIPSNASVVVWVNEGGTLSAYSNQTPVDTGIAVDTSRWIRIQVQSDYVAKEWSLWANGEKLIDRFGFYSDTLSGLTRVSWRSYDGSIIYVDDVRIGTAAWNPQPGDTDGDGLDDDWEVLYFNSPNILASGTGNLDGDELTDGDEEIAGTDPTDSNSVFSVSETGVEIGEGFMIHWPSADGRLYSVDGRTNLVSGMWSNVESNIAATPPMNTYTVQTDNAEILFNRVKVRKQKE